MTKTIQYTAPIFFCMAMLVGCVVDTHTTDTTQTDDKTNLSISSGAGTTVMEKNQSNQTISYLKGVNLFLTANITEGTDEEKCMQYINHYRDDFKLQNPRAELIIQSTQTDDLGYSHIKFSQQYRSLDIWMSSLSMHLNQNDQLYLVKGEYFPTPEYLDTDDAIDAQNIVSEAASKNSEISDDHFFAKKMIYFDSQSEAILVYKLTPTNALVGRAFLVDARTANVIRELPIIQT